MDSKIILFQEKRSFDQSVFFFTVLFLFYFPMILKGRLIERVYNLSQIKAIL